MERSSMSGISINVQIEDKAVHQAFTRLITVMGDTTPIMSAIGTGRSARHIVGSSRRNHRMAWPGEA